MILPDVRGLHPFYAGLTGEFARAGFESLALDYYSRATEPGAKPPAADWRRLLPGVEPEQVGVDVATGASFLGTGPLFVVGFCFGGGHAWRLAATLPGLAGSIGFYGLPYLAEPVVDRLAAPILMLLAGQDDETPRREYEQFVARVAAAGKACQVHVYEAAPHSFFDRTGDEWQAVCADAWRRVLAFMAAPIPGQR